MSQRAVQVSSCGGSAGAREMNWSLEAQMFCNIPLLLSPIPIPSVKGYCGGGPGC